MSSAGHILFSDVLKLYVKSPDERERVVRINVELLSGSSPVGEKSVCVKVTDEEDPFFFYGITVNHDEFQSLKSHQNLLIEFNKFPEQLVHLLKQCCTKADSPKYLLLLEEDSSESVLASHQLYLKFVEKNDFKQLCHLALKVGDPSNAELKEYMASKIKSLKDAAIKSDRKISLLEAELAKMKSDLAVACSVQDENNKKWLEEKNALEIAHVREITAERERLADAKLLWQKEEEQRKANEQKDVGDRIRKLELEITTVRAQYDETRDKLSAAKEQIFKLSEELSTKSSELAGLRQELPLLRKRNIVLDKDYHEKQKQLAMANADNMQLRQELNERASEAANYLAEVVSVREEKAELKNNFDIQARECQLLLRQNEELRQDVFKANSIICNVRGQFDDVCRELLLKNTMLAQQEKLLAEKERNIQELGGELKHAVEKVKMLESCRDDLNQQLHSAAEQLKVKDRELESNKNVIGWLNRKLTESQIISPTGPVSASTPYRGFSGAPGVRPFTTPSQPISYPCQQTSRPRWGSDPSTFTRFPSANVRWSSPESVVPTTVQGAHAVQSARAVQGVQAVQSDQAAQSEAVAQGEVISQLGGPQETVKKMASQQECQPVDAPSLRKKSTEPTRGSLRAKSVKPRNAPSSYFPGAV